MRRRIGLPAKALMSAFSLQVTARSSVSPNSSSQSVSAKPGRGFRAPDPGGVASPPPAAKGTPFVARQQPPPGPRVHAALKHPAPPLATFRDRQRLHRRPRKPAFEVSSREPDEQVQRAVLRRYLV